MILKNNSEIRLIVIGNTDQYGDADYNKELSKKKSFLLLIIYPKTLELIKIDLNTLVTEKKNLFQ